MLEHTLRILTERAGITDPDALTQAAQNIIEPLVAQDGVANPKAATLQYIKDYIAKMQDDADSNSPGFKLAGHGKAGLDLEG